MSEDVISRTSGYAFHSSKKVAKVVVVSKDEYGCTGAFLNILTTEGKWNVCVKKATGLVDDNHRIRKSISR